MISTTTSPRREAWEPDVDRLIRERDAARAKVEAAEQALRQLLEANLKMDRERSEARAEVEALQDMVEDMVPKTWAGLAEILDYAYPEKVFPTLEDNPDRDLGPRVVSLLRLLTEARAEVERLQEQLRGLVARWQRIIRPDGEDQALAALTWQVEAVLDHRNV